MKSHNSHQKKLWNNSAHDYYNHCNIYSTHRRITHLLSASVSSPPNRILDFGCGPGNSTKELSLIFPSAKLIIGVDTSKNMIGIANTIVANNNIKFLCADEYFHDIDLPPFDAIFLSNSFFHVENKDVLLANLNNLLTDDGSIYISMYESVYIPNNRIYWPYSKSETDTLIYDLIEHLKNMGYSVPGRKEDRQIFTEDSFSKLFKAHTLNLSLSGMIRLYRPSSERISFLKVPVVSKEVFPDIPENIVKNALDKLNISLYSAQERVVYAFKSTA